MHWGVVWYDMATLLTGCYMFTSRRDAQSSDPATSETREFGMTDRSAADSALEVDDRFPHGSLPSASDLQYLAKVMTDPCGFESIGVGIHPSSIPVIKDHSTASSVFQVHMIHPDCTVSPI